MSWRPLLDFTQIPNAMISSLKENKVEVASVQAMFRGMTDLSLMDEEFTLCTVGLNIMSMWILFSYSPNPKPWKLFGFFLLLSLYANRWSFLRKMNKLCVSFLKQSAIRTDFENMSKMKLLRSWVISILSFELKAGILCLSKIQKEEKKAYAANNRRSTIFVTKCSRRKKYASSSLICIRGALGLYQIFRSSVSPVNINKIDDQGFYDTNWKEYCIGKNASDISVYVFFWRYRRTS